MTDDKVQTLIRYVMLALNQIYIIEYKGLLRPSDSANRSFVDTKIGVFQENTGRSFNYITFSITTTAHDRLKLRVIFA